MAEPVTFIATPQELECEYYSMTPIDAAVALCMNINLSCHPVIHDDGSAEYAAYTNDELRKYIRNALLYRDGADPEGHVIVRRVKTAGGQWFICPMRDEDSPTDIRPLVLRRHDGDRWNNVFSEGEDYQVLKRTYKGITEVIFDPRKDDPYVSERGTEVQPSEEIPV